MGAHDQIPHDPTNSWHRCAVPFVGGAFRNYPLQSDQEGLASGRSPSSHKRNPRSATLSAGPHAAARRSTSSAEDEAATDHRPPDEMFAASPNTKHEPPGGRGADDPLATTKNDHAAVDVGSAAVGVNPTAGCIARPSPGHRSPRLGNQARRAAETTALGRRPRSRHGSHHADPRSAPPLAGGHHHRSIVSSARTGVTFLSRSILFPINAPLL
jgi:hypothetical protein